MANEHIINNDVQISGSLNVSQSISASAFYGDGSGLLYVTASSQWNGILTGSADITGSLRVDGGTVDLRLATGVSGSFSGSFRGNGSGLTNLNLNGYQASGSNFTGSFSGSFVGNGAGLTGITASFFSGSASNAVSSSYAVTASHLTGIALSSSFATSASYAVTASHCTLTFTSAQTASYVNPLVQDVLLTGSLNITGSQAISSTLQVTGKIRSEAGVEVLTTNGLYWKAGNFGTTAVGGVGYSNGIAFYSNGLVTPRMFISESGNIGIATTNPSLGRLHVVGNVFATSFTGSLLGTASFATTASYALNGGGGAVFPYTGSALITGSLEVTGSLSQGAGNIATGDYSHAEGLQSQAIGDQSHAEGYTTYAVGLYSHAEGVSTHAQAQGSHAEGAGTYTYADNSHAEGSGTYTYGGSSHAEGSGTQTYGAASHAEGLNTITRGDYSHAEGTMTQAIGVSSHAEGYYTIASASYSHAAGNQTVASGSYQSVVGQFNVSSSAQSAFIIGNGTSNSARSNLVFASGSTFQVTGSLNVTGSLTIKGAPSYIYMNDNAGGLWRVSVTTGGTFQIESIA